MVVHIIDIETTGFNNVKDDILEVGYIRCDGKCKILGHGTLYFYRDSFAVESQAQQVHGLTRDFLKQYEGEFTMNLAALYTLMSGAIVVGKNNISFDDPFIQKFLEKYLVGVPVAVPQGEVDVQKTHIEHFRKWYEEKNGCKPPSQKRGSLSEYIESIGYTQEQVQELYQEMLGETDRAQAHGALYDAFMTYLVFAYDACHRE